MVRQAFNLPNLITLLRILLIPIFLLVLFSRIPSGELWASALFVAGALTDGVDGYIARRRGQVTVFGKLMDPLADKLLVAAALVALVELGVLSTWVVLAILGREFAVTGLRALAAADGVVIAAGPLGKVKTALQVVAILTVLVGSRPDLGPVRQIGPWMMALAVAATLVSGLDYGWRYLRAAQAR
ncbi:MAG: CDP-diacylglycerol--glycerol-3-phosphate 3-phosphatidyltransferase [Firmicutes bacterium]|nr:CDP-diacylglycerol--glycerol-3-phosphate 3-phosphatidyltransferase [Bacillota bacterium]